MSDLNIRRALTMPLEASIPFGNIEYENISFNPQGKSYYVSFDYFPSTNVANGKTQVDSLDQNGFVQVMIYTRLNGDYYDELSLQTMDTIKAAFSSGLETSYNGQVVEIGDSTDISPSKSESWRQRGLTINYQAFKERV